MKKIKLSYKVFYHDSNEIKSEFDDYLTKVIINNPFWGNLDKVTLSIRIALSSRSRSLPVNSKKALYYLIITEEIALNDINSARDIKKEFYRRLSNRGIEVDLIESVYFHLSI